jgi:hypothetical protein
MAEPQTPGDARRAGIRKSRWVAAGVAVGAAALLTGVIAGVNGVDGSGNADGSQISSVVPGGSSSLPQLDDSRGRGASIDDEYGDYEDYESARPFDPQSGSGSTQQLPSGSSTQVSPRFQPQTRSGGS